MNITYRQMDEEDIIRVTKLYTEYWNGTGDNWTDELAYKRIWQVLGSPDSYGIIGEDGKDVIGFAMGRFVTLCNVTSYNLVEIIIASEYQKAGIGTNMMMELEKRVKKKGASIIRLISVNDMMHEHFYGKLGYDDSDALRVKSKLL